MQQLEAAYTDLCSCSYSADKYAHQSYSQINKPERPVNFMSLRMLQFKFQVCFFSSPGFSSSEHTHTKQVSQLNTLLMVPFWFPLIAQWYLYTLQTVTRHLVSPQTQQTGRRRGLVKEVGDGNSGGKLIKKKKIPGFSWGNKLINPKSESSFIGQKEVKWLTCKWNFTTPQATINQLLPPRHYSKHRNFN